MEDQLRLLQQEMIHMQGAMQTTRQELDAAQQRLAAQPPPQAFSTFIDRRMLTKLRSFSGQEEGLVNIRDGDTSLLWSVEPQAVYRDGSSSACGGSAQCRHAARPAIRIANTFLLLRHVDGRTSSHTFPRTARQERTSNCGAKSRRAHEPKACTRAAGLLVKIPTAEFDVRDLLNRLEKWEHMIKQDAAIVEELESRAGTGHVKDRWFAKNGQSPLGIGKDKSGQGAEGKGKGKNKDDKTPPEGFRSGHKDGRYLASVAQAEPVKEVGGLQSSTWATMS